MCTNPRLLPNPNRGSKNSIDLALKDCESQYIEIPCGHCGECIAVRQADIIQRCQLESLSGYVFFCTLTYQDKYIPEYVVDDDFTVRYSSMDDVRNMMKRLRRHNAFGRPFRYFGVTELGEKRARPHVHILFFVERYQDDSVYTPVNLEHLMFREVLQHWQRNIAKRVVQKGKNKGKIIPNTRSPHYVNLCQFVSKWYGNKLHSTYDLHYVVPSLNGDSADVAFYVTKYMLKDSVQKDNLKSSLKFRLPKDEFDNVWSVVKTRHFQSINFGFGTYGYQVRRDKDIKAFIIEDSRQYVVVRTSIDRSLATQDKPRYFDLSTGRPVPLSRYFYHVDSLYTPEIAKEFRSRQDLLDGVMVKDDRSYDEKLRSEFDGERRKLLVQGKITFFDYM